MSADEVNGLGTERLAELREKAGRATAGEWAHVGLTAIESRHECSPTHRCRGVADTSQTSRAEDELAHRPQAMADAAHIAAFDPPTVLALLDEVDRLTRERDEALIVGAADGLVAAAYAIHNETEAIEVALGGVDHVRWWLRDRADALRAALSDERASGRDQAARPSSAPPRPPEHPTSATEPVEWTFDGPAVRSSDDDDDEGDDQ